MKPDSESQSLKWFQWNQTLKLLSELFLNGDRCLWIKDFDASSFELVERILMEIQVQLRFELQGLISKLRISGDSEFEFRSETLKVY